ncbi:hypothetical protein ACJ72_03175 [Emergomyces africanus]|uniref:Uncharacterized protein n=1 Tax=Emergomyces africanus TaxID=1955775 RepID=A0A1B7P0D2_9EURO|nr:hypothetical protein ACJ72_03175 [Emergomyces africanus]
MSLSSPPIKSERRVLVEKSTNASLTFSPNSPSTTKSSISSMSAPVLAGQKRSIDQVDCSQNRSSSAKSSFSQVRREDEFYIYEENNTQSSTDADKQIMSASFPQTARSFDQAMAPKQTASQQSDTMSSLLNLSSESESNSSSPNSSSLKNPTQATPTKTTAPSPSSTVPTDPVERKAFIKQKASLLRSRVQSAMKNIKAPQNQIDSRLSALETQASSRDRPYLPHPLRSLPCPINIKHTRPQQQQEEDGDDGDEDLTPRAKIPKLLPAPILHPKTYSYAPTNTMLSSPPASAKGENYGETMEAEIPEHHHGHGHEHAENELTSTQAKAKNLANSSNNNGNTSGTANCNSNGNGRSPTPEIPTSPMQPYSPPHTGDSPIVIERDAKMCSVDQMIAKAKKGEAVDGLLKLMKTTTEYDRLDEWTG